MGTFKRMRVGEVEWRTSRDLEEMAEEAVNYVEYQAIMDAILRDTKKNEIMSKKDNLRILQDFKSCLDQMKVMDVKGNRLLYEDNKLVPPADARHNLIKSSHQGHLGVQTIYSNMSEVIWWSRMHKEMMDEATK